MACLSSRLLYPFLSLILNHLRVSCKHEAPFTKGFRRTRRFSSTSTVKQCSNAARTLHTDTKPWFHRSVPAFKTEFRLSQKVLGSCFLFILPYPSQDPNQDQNLTPGPSQEPGTFHLFLAQVASCTKTYTETGGFQCRKEDKTHGAVCTPVTNPRLPAICLLTGLFLDHCPLLPEGPSLLMPEHHAHLLLCLRPASCVHPALETSLV